VNGAASPTVSVVMATHNGAEFITSSLESVLGQTNLPDEIIVVDDGSTDGSARLLAGYEHSIRVIRQANRGVSSAFNRAIDTARGEFVALAADDDIWEPRKIEWQRQILTGAPEVDIVVGHMRVFGRVEGEFRRPPGRGRLDPDALRRAQFDRNYLAAPTAVIRRSLFGRIGGFREDLPAEDYEFWLRALRRGAVFHYDARPVVRYRAHEGNLSRREWLMHETHYDVLRDYARDVDDPGLVRRVLARNRLIVARHRLAAGQHEDARRAFGAAFRHRPTVDAAAWSLLLRSRRLTRYALAGAQRPSRRAGVWRGVHG
jgi:glycosyltransferase involved in cell wall biosynthesis